MKSKIMKMLKDKDTAVVFDIDGVLAAYEDGEYHHCSCLDDQWKEYVESHDVYSTIRPLKTIQEWIERNKTIKKVFVCSTSSGEIEDVQKVKFVKNNYNIPESHIFFVRHNYEKLLVLEKIHKTYFPYLKERQIVMVEDTAAVLANIYEKSNYSTAHISSFIE